MGSVVAALGSRAQPQQLQHTSLVILRHAGSSWIRGGSCVSCSGRAPKKNSLQLLKITGCKVNTEPPTHTKNNRTLCIWQNFLPTFTYSIFCGRQKNMWTHWHWKRLHFLKKLFICLVPLGLSSGTWDLTIPVWGLLSLSHWLSLHQNFCFCPLSPWLSPSFRFTNHPLSLVSTRSMISYENKSENNREGGVCKGNICFWCYDKVFTKDKYCGLNCVPKRYVEVPNLQYLWIWPYLK